MAKFFIDRPVFAWVLALFIIVAGAISVTQLPIAQYPTIAPPSIIITATYPGASAKTLDDAVTSIIEQEMNGADGLLYIESVSQAGNGQATITVTFKPGTDPALAQVDVQNRLKRVEARLPSSVTQQGVQVDKTRSNFLLFATLASKDGKMDPVALGDYISRNVLNEIKRVPGVGQAVLFGTERAMRIWIDPAKLVGYKLTPTDVYNAIRNQNALVSAGTLGDLPSTSDQPIAATVVVEGQMTTTEQFGNIVLVSKPDGSQVRIKDVARLELGGQTYATSARINGQPISAIGVQLSPTGNALGTAKAVKAKLDELSKYFPAGVEYKVPYDTSKFVQISIEEVVKTLFEAMALVFLVMLVFLQNIRYTLIPSIVVPISLLGAFATMNALGFSINVLTMFGLVLAIGILVDDAIVVVENVERIMSEEGLPPREATRKAMGQITGAIIGITLVLMAVFIPMAFFSGSVGAIYRQFSLSMVASIFFSALMALTLTPALCATLLKPIEKGSHHEKKGFFGWFNRMFTSTTNRYQSLVERMLKKTFRYMVIYGALIAAVVFLFMRLPSSFLPNEDQGYIITNIQLPPAASANRTLEVIKKVEGYYQHEKAVENIVAVQGFSFSGNGPNAALVFTTLKDWSQRGADQTADAVAGRAFGALFGGIRDAIVFPLNPPPIPELGNATGFTFRLQDRGGLGHDALMAARNQLLGMAGQSKILKNVRPDGLEDSPQYQVDIDREKANALGVAFTDINAVLSTALGSAYANDFPNYGRQQRVIVQADKINRMQPEDIMNLYVRNTQGSMVPMSAFAKGHWMVGPVQLVRYNGYPSVRISGDATTGVSTGDAMDEMERLASRLPAGIGFEWTGQSLQEKSSGSQAPALYALSLLAVFLVLAALYESWSIPAAVILVVPLGVLGTLLGVTLRVMPDDVYFKVGLIAVVGLSAKNAILIIEFAKDLQAQGKGLIEATLEAVHLRFRPIIMTSFAFILGVLPLAIATGASSASQRAIGTGVMGGMITATVLAVVLVPVFFVVVRRIFKGSERQRRLDAAHLPLDEEI
ncbi:MULTISPECIES: efflux RND transporter permease subunit [Ralstonia solanacearum species complex]|uniref:efflux RND transporter permease subunit n=1 Tax=Ralstonia solanacearum species complex TaxID=3116862 RepID=UPI000E56E891|nr:efflux RND transporter permease subunit [Ralstonia solanacearum]BEU73633.1 efflux RND transporter permease subunit [Ralstonia pseudosolanacearum]AXV78405.1 multidrug efflux RND transporter permease subunit [Ralstonia solanacearum]AXV92429.1 multidrug efflux RND transporter permease subunit [Ralstonia solanacearum]AXW63298.1 multidrug efflux RND transporter permease subunit [Ralstonia solanacearum]AXW77316.1 multidrug efflux RND transporter permease subunit [Ralstonia solanacearum]